jgi:purine-binding chemotaxis protein CheW
VVDLVKIRRKAKKAKEKLAKELAGESGETAAARVTEQAPAPDLPAAILPPDGSPAEPVLPIPAGPASSSVEGRSDGANREGQRDADLPAALRTTADAAAKLEAFRDRVGRRGDVKLDADETSEQKEVELELLTFLVAGELYAIDIEQIVEIVPPRTPTRVPNAEPSVLGIISLRGTIVTVVDLSRRLNHPGLPLTDASRMIVVARHGETAAFTVDRVLRVVSFSPHALEFTPSVEGTEYHDYIMGVFRQDSALTILLDIDKVLSA